jgi:8-oxo-dGTP diphosphatase
LNDIVRVTAAILVKNGRIIIAQRNSGDPLCGKWELPGGKIEAGETPQACLKRELKEEFQIEVSVGDFLGSNVYHYAHVSIELLVYRTSWETGDIMLQDHADYKWITPETLGQYDFAAADMPFVEKLRRGEIAL